MLRLRRNRPQVKLLCQPCQTLVSLPVSGVELFICLEDDWYTAVFVCPQCNCKRSLDPDKVVAAQLQEQGVQLKPWSAQRHFSPQVTAVGTFYKPRPVPRTWLPFDEVDVVHLVNDMNTCDWFQRLAAYNPHVN